MSPLRLPMSAADLDETDLEAVVEVMRDGRLALGPKLQAFEEAMAHFIGVPHAVAVSSGTAALHLLVRGLGLGPGDEVLVPSFTFVASVNALLFEGVVPRFVDCLPTGNLDPSHLESLLTPNTRAIMAVDVFGHPADWDALERISETHGIPVLDDCCEALGAEHQGRRLGTLGAAGAFAFYPNKQITTGEGGMIVTKDAGLAELCRSLANQGRGAMGAWLEHEHLGYNYRMDELSAALGCSQLRRIEDILDRRDQVAAWYDAALQGLPQVEVPLRTPGNRPSWFVYVVTLAEDWDRDQVIPRLEAMGIPARGYFSPVHTQPYIQARFGDLRGTLPGTEALARRTLALPFHTRMSREEVLMVVEVLRFVLS